MTVLTIDVKLGEHIRSTGSYSMKVTCSFGDSEVYSSEQASQSPWSFQQQWYFVRNAINEFMKKADVYAKMCTEKIEVNYFGGKKDYAYKISEKAGFLVDLKKALGASNVEIINVKEESEKVS